MEIKKTVISNLMLVDIMKNLFQENNFSITTKTKGSNGTTTTICDFLQTKFYCFQADSTVQGFYGASAEEQTDYIAKLSKTMHDTMALCEVSNISMLASEDIDGGNFDGTISFFIPTDKIAMLDQYISILRNKYIGTYETGVNANGDTTAIMMKIGELVVNDYPFQSPIGRANVCTLTINFGYMLKAINYTDEKISISLDGLTYTEVPFLKSTMSIVYNSLPNTVQNAPMHIGEIPNSASMTLVLSYYEFNKFSILSDLRKRILYLCSNANKLSQNQNLSNIVYVKYTFEQEEYIYTMQVKDYVKNIVNTDFSNTTLTLGLNALEE